MRLLRLLCGVCVFGAVAYGGSPALEHPVYTFDARTLAQLDLRSPTNAVKLWDTLHVVSALQGLANRSKPQLYIFCCSDFGVDTDQFWFDWARREGWLASAPVRELRSVEEALKVFRSVYHGLVVYDPAVPATSNLGSTAAGCENLIPVRYDPSPGSLYDRLTREMKLEVKLWLLKTNGASMFTGQAEPRGTGAAPAGSAKTNAYGWSLERWVRSGRAAPRVAAYYIDSKWLSDPLRGTALHTLCNHDYFIARKSFFFDLSPWGDEPASDDPLQAPGSDKRMLLEILRAIYDRSPGQMIQVGGFIPWVHKYTSDSLPPGAHGGVPTEWEFARLITQYNGYMEADAPGLSTMANASFFQHYPLKRFYPQKNKRPSFRDWKSRGYVDGASRVAGKLFVGHYVGDYDAPSWFYKAVPKFFPHRAKTPLGWAFDPNLADRAPQAMVYARMNAGSNDWFIAGDSGAGYLNPRGLTARPDSGLPEGLTAWAAHCTGYYTRWDLSITGFMLDGASGPSTDREYAAYARFSPDGIGTHFEPVPCMKAGVATCRETDLPEDPAKAANVILRTAAALKGKTGFLWCRSILRDPQWYDAVSDKVAENPGAKVQIVDPYTFFGVVKLHTTGNKSDP